jgi:FixJ family two-component response regulator
VAIVDPDPRLRQILHNALTDLPVQVEDYSSAESLLASLQPSRLTCIVAEIELPGVSGLELIAQLRHLGIFTPTILLTSRNGVADAVGAMRAGAIDYLQKPFVHHKVRDRVRQLMQLTPA